MSTERKKRVLNVMGDAYDGLHKRICAAGKKTCLFDREYDGAAAIARIEDPRTAYEVVVVTIRLAPDDESAVEDAWGIKVCTALDKRKDVGRVALVVPRYRSSHEDLLRRLKPSVTQIVEGDEDELHKFIQEAKVPSPYLEVLISSRQGSPWEYQLRGVGVDYGNHGDIHLGPGMSESWILASRLLNGRSNTWLADFRELGKAVHRGIFASEKFRTHIHDGIKAVDGVENTRVTFAFDEANYPIALESVLEPFAKRAAVPAPEDEAALKKERTPEDEAALKERAIEDLLEHWMMRAPLMRSIGGLPRPVPDFFAMDHLPNCLVLCADTQGTVDDLFDESNLAIRLPEITYPGAECKFIRKLLAEHKAGNRVGRIAAVGFDEPLTRKRLFELFESGVTWDIVHFAGHSQVDGKGNGYIFLHGAGDRPEPIAMKEFAPLLRNTGLLYLSSCHSSNAAFATKAARQGVSAVIGFRAPVSDKSALLYAQTFYERLLSRRPLDWAFLETRQALRDNQSRDNTWASAMLVMGTLGS